ncbi:MAG TPA: hypothetical protein VG986_17915 [Pseudolabrys sp.]|nr:hypothetical protein [Pseudolabrys sp.]
MCMACEMFWMVAEEPPAPMPKRRARKAKAAPEADFACDAPVEGEAKPANEAKAAKPRASRAKRRSPRVESEPRP